MNRTISNKVFDGISFLSCAFSIQVSAFMVLVLRIISYLERKGTTLLDIIISTTTPPYAPSRQLNIFELDYYVNTEEGVATLKEEYRSIKGGQRKPWTEALKPENVKKNRYDDLPAYDETRVKLQDSYEGQTSDYINANYINGTNREKEYIATQGPLNITANDFWAMIWQENVNKIVVLANLTEKGESKVFKYWPENEDTYGNIVVKMISEKSLDEIDQVVRSFVLEKAGETRSVNQFHYIGWPDLGVPKDPMEIVALLRQVRLSKPFTTDPIVVHCSAGVGRTGTVILTDSMLERAKKEGVVNFPQRLDQMRLQRVDVVEKPEQYVFAHKAVHSAFSPDAADFLNKADNLYNMDVSLFTEELDSDDFEETERVLKAHL